MAPFSFLAPDHPLAPRLERFRAAIAARAPGVDGATVHTDLTLRPDADGGLVLHRAYWSAQRSGADGFAATTRDYIRAAPVVLARHPGALFLVVGSTAKEDAAAPLLDLARAGGVEDAVRFTGYVDDMPALYAAIVGDGPALLVPPSDPGALAGAIDRVLANRDAARAMGAAGRERARAFSWARSAATLEAVYDEVLAGR